MTDRRFDVATMLVLLGALALLVSVPLEWYSPGLSGLEVFETLDFVLAGIAGGAAFLVLRPAAERRRLPLLGVVAVVIVVFQVIEAPPLAAGNDTAAGIWVALAGSLVLLTGGVMVLNEINLTIDVRGRTDGPSSGLGRGGAGRRERVPAVDRRDDAPASPPTQATRVAPAPLLEEDDDERTRPFRPDDVTDSPPSRE